MFYKKIVTAIIFMQHKIEILVLNVAEYTLIEIFLEKCPFLPKIWNVNRFYEIIALKY